MIIDVVDHGDGIPPDRAALVFDRFVRGRHTASGMGLGLPIARAFAVALGGVVELVEGDRGPRSSASR